MDGDIRAGANAVHFDNESISGWKNGLKGMVMMVDSLSLQSARI